jgi:hypothetical protein
MQNVQQTLDGSIQSAKDWIFTFLTGAVGLEARGIEYTRFVSSVDGQEHFGVTLHYLDADECREQAHGYGCDFAEAFESAVRDYEKRVQAAAA